MNWSQCEYARIKFQVTFSVGIGYGTVYVYIYLLKQPLNRLYVMLSESIVYVAFENKLTLFYYA